MKTSSTSPAVKTESPHLLAELKTPCEPVLAFSWMCRPSASWQRCAVVSCAPGTAGWPSGVAQTLKLFTWKPPSAQLLISIVCATQWG